MILPLSICLLLLSGSLDEISETVEYVTSYKRSGFASYPDHDLGAGILTDFCHYGIEKRSSNFAYVLRTLSVCSISLFKLVIYYSCYSATQFFPCE